MASIETTCWAWTQGTCPKSALACDNAHHFFLSTTYLAHSKADKNSFCRDYPNCDWGDSRCGCKHEEGDTNPETEKQMKAKECSMPWETRIVLKCKICGREEVGGKDMGTHMRISHRAWWSGEDERSLAAIQLDNLRLGQGSGDSEQSYSMNLRRASGGGRSNQPDDNRSNQRSSNGNTNQPDSMRLSQGSGSGRSNQHPVFEDENGSGLVKVTSRKSSQPTKFGPAAPPTTARGGDSRKDEIMSMDSWWPED